MAARSITDQHLRLARLLLDGTRNIALTGAGVSTASGIPDFRSSDGLWERYDPHEVATLRTFKRNPKRFWEFYREVWADLPSHEPNEAHRALAELERRGLLECVLTQNIDGLHQKAGSRDVVELHGTTRTCSCVLCGEQMPWNEVLAILDAGDVPVCESDRCNAKPVKPDVVLFGEQLPGEATRRAVWLSKRADLILCVGSSLEVQPVASLPGKTYRNGYGGKIAVITRSDTSYDRCSAVRLRGDITDDLAQVMHAIDEVARARDAR